MGKYRIKMVGRDYRTNDPIWECRHPDGYWVGPAFGMFSSVADAMNWLGGRI